MPASLSIQIQIHLPISLDNSVILCGKREKNEEVVKYNPTSPGGLEHREGIGTTIVS